MLKIRLAENFRAVFYAPFYALKELTLAEDQGVQIEWIAPDSPGGAIDDVKSGSVDLTWGGPMRVLKDYDGMPAEQRYSPNSLICFGEVVSRDPFYLIGKPERNGFSLAALSALQLGIVSEVPTPWLCLQADLTAAGVDIGALKAGSSVHNSMNMGEQVEALRTGDLDVVQVFEPYVSQALTDGEARILYDASLRGPTVYTTFICSRGTMERHEEAFSRLNKAVQALENWIVDSGPVALTKQVESYFPDVPSPLLQESIARYFSSGIWSRTPHVSRAGFDRLADSLAAGGFIKTRATYETCTHQFSASKV